MKQVDLNTINCVKKQVAEGKRTLKKIAYDCSYFEKHADCDEAKAAYARLADCKTRAQFNAVIKSL